MELNFNEPTNNNNYWNNSNQKPKKNSITYDDILSSLNLVVNPIPLPNPIITDYELCDYTNSGDGIEVFNLGTKSTEIANGQTGVTVTYYASLADAQAQTSPLPNLYPNTSNPQQVWINIRDNATGCNTTGFFNLIVNPLPVVVLPQPIFQCSNGISSTALFDLTVNEGTVTAGVTGVTVTYYHLLLDKYVRLVGHILTI